MYMGRMVCVRSVWADYNVRVDHLFRLLGAEEDSVCCLGKEALCRMIYADVH